MASETDLLHLMIERAPHALPSVRVFRRNIINRTVTEHGRTYQLRNGIPGQADAYAITRGGLHVELEAKAAKGKLRTAQEAWRDFCRTWEIPYLELRAGKGETPDETVTRWISELRAVVEGKAA